MKFKNQSIHVGGSLKYNYPYYVKREADHLLYNNLISGEFCYVLTARQMGKSSLLLRTKHMLEEQGYYTLLLDLTSFVSQETYADEWYYTFIFQLNELKNNIKNMREWWNSHEPLSPLGKMNVFIRNHFLPALDKEIVIFIDEIDKLLTPKGERFHIDDFFAAIRSYYNGRAEYSEFRKMNFAFFGVAAPSELINDPQRTPFNIGKSIDLRNFYRHELDIFKSALDKFNGTAEQVLDAIFAWTNGQPVLTTSLAKIMAEEYNGDEPGSISEKVSQAVKELTNDREKNHFENIKNRIHAYPGRAVRMTTIYQQLYFNNEIAYDAADDAHIYLKLTGLVLIQDNVLVINNSIYKEVFNSTWITKTLREYRRPYAEELNLWLRNNKNANYLLTGRKLKLAHNNGDLKRKLTPIEHEFIHASQDENMRKVKRGAAKIGLAFLAIVIVVISIFQNRYNEEKKRKNDLAEAKKEMSLQKDSIHNHAESLSVAYRRLDTIKRKIENQKQQYQQQNKKLATTQQKLKNQKEAAQLGHKAEQLKDIQPYLAIDYARRAYRRNPNGMLKHTMYEIYKEYVGYDTLADPPRNVGKLTYYQEHLYIATNTDKRKFLNKYNRDGVNLTSGQLKDNPQYIYAGKDSVVVLYLSSMDIFNPDLTLRKNVSFSERYWATFYNSVTGKVMGVDLGSGAKICRGITGKTPECYALPYKFTFIKVVDKGSKMLLFDDNKIRLADNKGKLLGEFAHEGVVNDYVYAPKEQMVLTATRKDKLMYWQVNPTRKRLEHTVKSEILYMQLSEDGQLMVSSHADNSVKIWDMRGQLLQSFHATLDGVNSLQFLKNNKRIAAANDRKLRIFENHIPAVHYVGDNLREVLYNKRTNHLYAFTDSSLVVLDPLKGEVQRRRLQPGPIIDAAVHSESGLIACVDAKGKAHIIKEKGGEPVEIARNLTQMSSITQSMRNNHFYAATKEGYVLELNKTGAIVDTMKEMDPLELKKIRLSPDKRWLAIVYKEKETEKEHVLLHDTQQDTSRLVSAFFEAGSSLRFTNACKLIYAEKDNSIGIYDPCMHKKQTRKGIRRHVMFSDWHKKRNVLLAAPAKGKVVLRNAEGYTFQESMPFNKPFVNMAFINGNNRFYIATQNGAIYIYKLKAPLQFKAKGY